jgi:hypothetical protein
VLLPVLAASVALTLHSQIKTIELYRGAEVEGVKPRYWETEDTTLDSTATDINQGWQSELYGGDGKTILIQFLGLNRALGPNKRITKASIVFTISSGNKITLGSIGRVLQPWNQGPVRGLLEMNPDNAPTIGALGSATWRHRRIGGASWAHSGALGEEDSQAISVATGNETDQDHFEIGNLAAAVQAMYDRPNENHGFVLQFKTPVSFFSAESPKARPRLVLQVEDAGKKNGADLTVTYIERRQKYERYQNEGGQKIENQDGQAVPVLDHALNDMSKKWPSENEECIYVAHVKNIGNSASAGFTVQPYFEEKPSGPTQQGQALQPGEEVLIPVRLNYKNVPGDHRFGAITFLVTPSGDDANPSDKQLTIQEQALCLGIFVEKGFYSAAENKVDANGAHGFENWIQQQVALVNDVYFPYSRFSFAKDGVVERLRIDHIEVVPDGTLQGAHNLPEGKVDLTYDAELGFPSSDSADLDQVGPGSDLALVKRLFLELGLADFGAVSFPAGDPRLSHVGKEGAVSRGTEDLYPGLLGGGDTRDDAPLPLSYSLPYQPIDDEALIQANLLPTDLLSATSVSAFNTDLGKRRGFDGDYLYDTPAISTVTAYDYNGNPIPKAQLTFYQMAAGTFSESSRSFNLNTGDGGIVGLFTRDPLTGGPDKLVVDHVLQKNPFGRIDSRGLNGTFMVKATTAAGSEWAPLKLWQLNDADHRGQKIALLRLYFNLPSDPLNVGTDVAEGKAITSSAGTGADLSKLLDGKNTAEIPLPKENGSWIEIDLGRDLTVGEVSLITSTGHFWNQFELRTYETAQKPNEALLWAKERNWVWSFRNRPDPVAGGSSIAYRGSARRFRYLRIINSGGSADAALSGIRLVPVKQGG